MLERDHKGMPSIETAPKSPYLRGVLKLAFLAPSIQQDILAGRQPRSINLQQLIQTAIPLCWKDQHIALNWPDTR